MFCVYTLIRPSPLIIIIMIITIIIKFSRSGNLFTRARRAVQENEKTAFRLILDENTSRKKQLENNDNHKLIQGQWAQQTQPTSHTHTYTHTHTHTHTHIQTHTHTHTKQDHSQISVKYHIFPGWGGGGGEDPNPSIQKSSEDWKCRPVATYT